MRFEEAMTCPDTRVAALKVPNEMNPHVSAATEEEPEWVEVMVDILLSLLSQPSRLIRQVCRTVFASICPIVTPAALAAILDVSEGLSLQDLQSIPETSIFIGGFF